MSNETKHTPEYTTGPYTTSGKRNLIHIETSTDSPEAGIHICSVPKNSPNIDLLVNSWDVHARFNAIHTGAKLAKIAGTQIDPDLILHNTIGYAVQSACAETAKQNLSLLKENQELKARCQVHANMVGQLAEKLERKEALNAELLEVLDKARRAIQQAATESYREEIQRYLSGGYAEMIQAACIKDSLGIESAINKAKAQ